MKSIKGNSGITLITLAVTIVVILILAGVTLDVTLGENGILNKSKEAANRMNNLVKEDEAELNELLDELNETMDSNWDSNIEIPEENLDLTYTEDGVPIPAGFYYVGGTKSEGVVISDNVEDKNKGINHEIAKILLGNQFVWIPVGRVYKDSTGTNYSDIQLGRYTFDRTNGTPTPIQLAYTEESPENYKQLVTLETYHQEYATRANQDGVASGGKDGLNAIAKNLGAFVDSVRNNGGYYLGRYEASYGNGDSVANYKPLSKVSTGTPRTSSSTALTQGMLWNYVTQIDGAKISRNMYNNDSSVGVESDLVNSYAWDTAIVFIQAMGNGNENYANKTSVNESIANTGTTGDEVCNIHDMASNCLEWSTEYSTFTNSRYAYPCVPRGGYYTSSFYGTASRLYDGLVTNKDSHRSFRLTLYVK